ncbi:MAG: phage shock protein PspA [Deltaproteobacteria bacterium]|nr:phage shock protein PspA [Deltaproteobacteria bacterium]MBW2052051.1 phage shock protein PspA [Deltaproteobacteria bacterium]MBW2142003.1 phage shock protein PspA [Deltaproteobacteria bacterium]MBW2322090.1 phage shock protein PspA [Deltaproteobacteria bacterium]
MGVFSRFRDIINANINSMLDRAEDPEKMIRLMIQEMEDTLVEIKASCAGAIANKKRIQRMLTEARKRSEIWNEKAQLAVTKGREDLAREALLEKRRFGEKADSLQDEMHQYDAIVQQYQDDIRQLEEKLHAVREKQRVLVQRHIHAQKKRQAQEEIRHSTSTDAFIRFEQFENRIERMEAEADLVNAYRKPGLEEEFVRLEGDEEVEKELEALKARVARGSQEDSPDTGQDQ